MNTIDALITKYDVQVPRYTSYPILPKWQNDLPDEHTLFDAIISDYDEKEGLSLYIHLPFCEKLCTYCGCNKRITKNHAVEEVYIAHLLKEWDIYTSNLPFIPTIAELHFGGGTPTFFSPDNLDRLLHGIFLKAKKHPNPAYAIELHPDSTSLMHLEVLRVHDFNRISIGVQDINEMILKAINRFQTTEQIETIVAHARAIGFTSINFDLIYGLPFQTMEHIASTMKFVSRMMPDRIAYYSYAHVPWKSKGQRAYDESNLPLGKAKFALAQYGASLFASLGYKDVGMDHFCLPTDEMYKAQIDKKLNRNFMGYTTSNAKITIGLGASSISETSSTYTQNEKEIEAYYETITSGVLPIIKSHVLSEEQGTLKSNIMSLMCNGVSKELDAKTSDLINKRIDQYISLNNDGLVYLEGNMLHVTDAGKSFVRNICTLIDVAFEMPNQPTNRFSRAI